MNPQNYHPDDPVSSPKYVNGTPDWVKGIIDSASQSYNIPTMMLSALIKQESGFNPRAQSPVGAQGIAQFMPSTAQGMGVNPLDPTSAINGAAKYLRQAWDKFGKADLALAAYNAGSGAVSKYGGVPPYKETQNYVKNIMSMAGLPHQSAYGPTLDMINSYQKASQPPKPTAPAPKSAPLSMPSGLQNSPLLNDMGQEHIPGFWQGYWADQTGQAVENRSDQIINQRSPLIVPNNNPTFRKGGPVLAPNVPNASQAPLFNA